MNRIFIIFSFTLYSFFTGCTVKQVSHSANEMKLKKTEENLMSAECFNNRGLAYFRERGKGYISDAISDFNRAIEINSRYAEAYYNRAIAYYEGGKSNIDFYYYVKARELVGAAEPIYWMAKDEFKQAWKDVQMAQSLGYQVDPDFVRELRKAIEVLEVQY